MSCRHVTTELQSKPYLACGLGKLLQWTSSCKGGQVSVCHIHYLMRGLGSRPSKHSKAYSLLAHADGTWVTSYDYPYNCNQWREWMFKDWPGVINDLVDQTYTDMISLETHLEVLLDLLNAGISKGRSRANVSQDIPSDWASIEGHQGLRFSIRTKREPWMKKFNEVWTYISDLLNWRVNYPESITDVVSGTAIEYPDRILKNQSLDEWMVENNVFSHAVTFRNVRYTTNLEL